ncbi:MAG: bifunctional nicotinamidase/pyrazinamidase [Desulfobulbaceae bacterium]|nr:bifunctional nicotinamidase/pyrazinamidase [Desulfobulbaceae bacterium]
MKMNEVRHIDSVELTRGDALVVVDMQNDFMPGGSLAVEQGDTFLNHVNELMVLFKEKGFPIVFTQDWHPPDHASFAGRHPGRHAFDAYEEKGIGPVLWPDHAVQGTGGAEFHPGLETRFAEAIIRKGYHREIDSYSGFLENDHQTETGLDGYLRGRNVKRIFICGLTADYCVYFTAADGAGKGYETYVLTDLTMPVNSPPGSVEKAFRDMREKGVRFVQRRGIQERKR